VPLVPDQGVGQGSSGSFADSTIDLPIMDSAALPGRLALIYRSQGAVRPSSDSEVLTNSARDHGAT
jgi:hypothetical protein